MGIKKQRRSTVFHCDICNEWHIEQHGTSWDEVRLATTRAMEAGWYIKKRGGKVQAFCPQCALTPDDGSFLP
jgi:hypothetical protein